uniref:Uncharacterized protein n=1 Tax=Rhizophora mucronata TaxID=61149 RepID=A0A2P2QUS5_RHIMU
MERPGLATPLLPNGCKVALLCPTTLLWTSSSQIAPQGSPT